MRTRRLISTVSFNTPAFLNLTCERLRASGVIELAYWVVHQPEDDERKAHIHACMLPARVLDTMELEKQFRELVPGESEPRGVLPFRVSKFADWFLYSSHNAGYLASKGQSRRFSYALEELGATCKERLLEDVKMIDMRPFKVWALVNAAVASGQSWDDLMDSGGIPPRNWLYFKELYNAARHRKVRSGSVWHEDDDGVGK